MRPVARLLKVARHVNVPFIIAAAGAAPSLFRRSLAGHARQLNETIAGARLRVLALPPKRTARRRNSNSGGCSPTHEPLLQATKVARCMLYKRKNELVQSLAATAVALFRRATHPNLSERRADIEAAAAQAKTTNTWQLGTTRSFDRQMWWRRCRRGRKLSRRRFVPLSQERQE